MLPALLSSRVLTHGGANICFPRYYVGTSLAGDKKIVRYTGEHSRRGLRCDRRNFDCRSSSANPFIQDLSKRKCVNTLFLVFAFSLMS